MSNTTKKTFQQIIKDNKIEIPIIQRDYAQGRDDDKIRTIRDNFLQAIFDRLKKNESLHLDFVYGSVENDKFIPLDGQQRLTTLFLLHWYLGKKESQDISFLEKFTYETRASSREFCQGLVGMIGTEIDFLKEQSLSQQIKDGAWFLTFWEKDPTVQSMLTMIDEIHQKFKDIDNGFARLNKISFEFLKMEHFSLTDDLYIKMNARGKALTDFENFKAKFQKYIEDQGFEQGESNPANTFSHKIDTVWLNLFWKYGKSDKSVDDKFMHFISNIAMQAISLDGSNLSKQDKQDLIQKLYKNPDDTQPENFQNQEAFDYLKDCFDLYADTNKKYDELKIEIELWQEYNKKLFTSSITKESISYRERVLFFAQTQYLLQKEKKELDQESFQDWMRVVRNIVHTTKRHIEVRFLIDDVEPFINTINLVKKLVAGCGDIYHYLKNNNIESNQVQQEILKAKLIIDDSSRKQVIFDTEDTRFCKGDIKFALYCIDFDEADLSSFNQNKLDKIKEQFKAHFSKNDITNQFRAALFTVKPNFYTYWSSWLYAVECPKYRLIESINDLKYHITTLGNDVKKLLNQFLCKTKSHSTNDLNTLLQNYQNDPNFSSLPRWIQEIIKDPSILDYSEKHYIAVPDDDSCCYLIPKTKVENSTQGLNRCEKIK